MKKWITKQSSAFVLGFLDKLKEFRSTPDNVVEALNIVTEYITNKYWHWNQDFLRSSEGKSRYDKR